jgi:hypothetical protein
MTKLRAFPLVALTVLLGAPAIGSEPTKLKCEVWHPRLGQNPDKLFAIDLDTKTCNGQPCSMSDTEFKWQEQNGRYETTVNRRSGDGTFVYQGELVFSYKNCVPISDK